MTTRTSKAQIEGYNDAQEWMADNPRSYWEDAAREAMGADELLINALGYHDAARVLGVEYVDADDNVTEEFETACAEYNKAFRAAIEQAIEDGGE